MTAGKLKEQFLPTFIALFFFLLNALYNVTSQLDMEKLMDKVVDLSSISFGFLLAVLALLLQGDNAALDRIKKSGKFGMLIDLNKRAVLASAALLIAALLYLGFNVADRHEIFTADIVRRYVDYGVVSILLYQLSAVYLFLDIFYFIVKQEK